MPSDDVVESFKLLERNIPEQSPPAVREFLDYFKKNYVSGIPAAGRRQAVPPRYPSEMWNLYDSTLAEEGATNNASEDWHNRFVSMLGKHHPDLYRLLTELQKEQGDTEIWGNMHSGRRLFGEKTIRGIRFGEMVGNAITSTIFYCVTRHQDHLSVVWNSD